MSTESYLKQLSRDRQAAAAARLVGSIESVWKTVPNTLPNTLAASMTAVSTVVEATADRKAIELDFGTSLMLRVSYPKNLATITDPIIKVLGVDKDGNYGFVFNGAEALTTAVSTAPTTDVTTGTYKKTDVSKYTIFDMQGYSKAFLFVSTTMNATTAATEVVNATFEYKVV